MIPRFENLPIYNIVVHLPHSCLPVFAWWRIIFHCFDLKQLLWVSAFCVFFFIKTIVVHFTASAFIFHFIIFIYVIIAFELLNLSENIKTIVEWFYHSRSLSSHASPDDWTTVFIIIFSFSHFSKLAVSSF